MAVYRVFDAASEAAFQQFIDENFQGEKTYIRDPYGAEIVVELEGYNFAVAAIYQSLPHWHQRTFESYEILRGRLAVIVAGVVTVLESPPGHVDIVEGRVHWSTGPTH